ncbi:MAG: hypothetical protein ACYC3I_16635 [Gemmataceae bacterium]
MQPDNPDAEPQHDPWQWLLVKKQEGDALRPPFRPLNGFEYLGLFRIFSEVELSREAILAFANGYGFLGLPRQGFLDHPWPPAFETAESLYDWASEIEKMRQAVEVWDLLRDNDKAGLRRLFRWGHRQSIAPDDWGSRPRQANKVNSGPYWWFYNSHPGKKKPNIDPDRAIAWPGETTDSMLAVPGLCEKGDIMTPARLFLTKWLNRSLEGVASPTMKYDKKSRRLNLHIVPKTLLAAMWLQLARAIDTDKTYRRCKACPRWFEVSAGNSRADRLFCSDACKSRDYRTKKLEALRLRGEHKKVHQIAQILGTTPDLVKKWLHEGKGK